MCEKTLFECPRMHICAGCFRPAHTLMGCRDVNDEKCKEIFAKIEHEENLQIVQDIVDDVFAAALAVKNTEPVEAESANTEPAQAKSSPEESVQDEPKQAESSVKVEPVQIETVQAEPVKPESVKAESMQTESVQTESVQAESVQFEPVPAQE